MSTCTGKYWKFEGSYKILHDQHLTLPPYPVFWANIPAPPWCLVHFGVFEIRPLLWFTSHESTTGNPQACICIITRIISKTNAYSMHPYLRECSVSCAIRQNQWLSWNASLISTKFWMHLSQVFTHAFKISCIHVCDCDKFVTGTFWVH